MMLTLELQGVIDSVVVLSQAAVQVKAFQYAFRRVLMTFRRLGRQEHRAANRQASSGPDPEGEHMASEFSLHRTSS